MIVMGARKQALADLCLQYNIEILYAFGSRGKEVKEWLDEKLSGLPAGPSDVDIGVKPVQGVTFSVHDKVRLAQSLEDLLGVTRVDLVSFWDADPFLAANIIRGERLFSRDEIQADEYDLYILRRAGDLAPFRTGTSGFYPERK